MAGSVLRNGFAKVGVFSMAAIIGLSTVLGGCSRVAKKDYDLAKQEAADLRDKNSQIEQQNRELSMRLTQLEADKAAAAAARPEPNRWGDPSGDTGYNGGGNSGGGSAFRENSAGNMVAELAGDVTFGSGSATLTSAAKKKLDGIAGELRNRYNGANVRVEGYTDRHQIKKSKWANNDALSQARAEAVEQYLVNKGVSGGRIQSVGYGSSKLRSTDAASRRVEIVILN